MTEVVLAVSYQPQVMVEEMKVYEKLYDIKITYSQETSPLGTAGPLALARDILLRDNDDGIFFVLNSDVTCEYPLAKLLDYHKAHGGEGTIMVTKVEEPSKYGVVVTEDSGKIKRFVEKPKVFVGNRINAGIYVFNSAVLDRIELRPTSIEKEIFPGMADEGQLYAMDLDGFWMDIGQPRDYLTGMCLYLASLANKQDSSLARQPEDKSYIVVDDTVLISPKAKIGKGCVLGPNVVIGDDAVVGDGARLVRTVLMKGSRVDKHSWVNSAIVGWNSSVGKWARIENCTVLGEDVHVADEVYVNGGMILPHKTVSSNILDPGAIIMVCGTTR